MLTSLPARIRAAKSNHSIPTNCIGTALFLVGLQEEDSYKSDYATRDRDIAPFLKNLEAIDSPVAGGLISWENESDEPTAHTHMAVVLSLNPFSYIARCGPYLVDDEGAFVRNDDLAIFRIPPEPNPYNSIKYYKLKEVEARLSQIERLSPGDRQPNDGITLELDSQSFTSPSLPFSRSELVDLDSALHRVPALQNKVLTMIAEPSFPGCLARIIRTAILVERTEIFRQTPHLEGQWGIPSCFEGLSIHTPCRYRIIESELHVTLNQRAKDVRPDCTAAYIAVTPERQSPNWINNDIARLMHELAHVRFSAFFERNLEKLMAALPPALVGRDTDGIFTIDRQLFDLLDELYGWEADRRSFKYLGQGFGAISKAAQESDHDGRRSLAHLIVRQYGIVDPRVVAIADLPLNQLLRGAAVRLPDISAVIGKMPDIIEYGDYACLDLARTLARHAQARDPETEVRWADEALRTVSAMTNSKCPSERMLTVITTLLRYYEDDAQALTKLTSFLEQPTVRAILAERLQWHLPSRSPLTLQDLVVTHPDMQPVLENHPPKYLTDEDDACIAMILIKACGFEQPALPPTLERFVGVYEAAEVRKRLELVLRFDKDDFTTTPLAEFPDRNVEYYGREKDVPPLARLCLAGLDALSSFWDALGLLRQFEDRFKDNPAAFWECRSSLLTLYREFAAEAKK